MKTIEFKQWWLEQALNSDSDSDSDMPILEEPTDYDELDMKVLGFKTTERLNGDWNSLLFEIRNYGDDENKSVGKNLFWDWVEEVVDEEIEYDECVGCEKKVKVDYETGKGYTIGNCNNCDMMLCRGCLESGTADMCKYCVVSVVENFAENLNSYPKEMVDKIIDMMKKDME